MTKYLKLNSFLGVGVVIFAPVILWAGKAQNMTQLPLSLDEGERLITLLQTNDIHGGVEAEINKKDGGKIGGLEIWAGIASSIRQGLNRQFGNRAGVLVLDAGDQFSGTLISNTDEGQLLFSAMNEVGYDAAIPGNHDYDFGPIGPEDQVTPDSKDQNPRGALLRLIGQAKFPLISANTYLKSSLKDRTGKLARVEPVNCNRMGGQDLSPPPGIRWEKALRPSFVKPYVIREAGGLRVALIGIDNPSTPTTTTAANVSDLCFRDEAQSYLDVRKQLEGQADVYVMVIHNGNTTADFGVSSVVRKIFANSPTQKARKGRVLDAVIAGHTHFVNNLRINGVPIIQSGSGGDMFGRIDLIWNDKMGAIDPARTRVFAGIQMHHVRCAPSVSNVFCAVSAKEAGSLLSYEGVPVVMNARVHDLVAAARKEISPIADRHLGDADGFIHRCRVDESPLADGLSDSFRKLSGSEIAFLNTGGLRAALDEGPVTYEDFYRVLPFGNHGVVIGPMTLEKVIPILERSIKTCGSYGALMQSGLKVQFVRSCGGDEPRLEVKSASCPTDGATAKIDENARLTRVETVDGELLWDQEHQFVVPKERLLKVATLDFLWTGGSGYDGFQGLPLMQDVGVLREALTRYWLENPAHFTSLIDSRWKIVGPSSSP